MVEVVGVVLRRRQHVTDEHWNRSQERVSRAVDGCS